MKMRKLKMSKSYEEKIIEKLIKKYQNSKLSKDCSTNNIKIGMVFDEKNMPDYVSDSSYLYEADIESSVNKLKDLGLITVDYNLDERIRKVYLNLSAVDNAYLYLGKRTLSDRKKEIMDLLKRYKDKGNIVKNFVIFIEERISNSKSTDKYFKTFSELEELLFILYKIVNQKEDISLRRFSAMYLNDSKRLEKMESKIISIIKLFGGFELDSEENILENFNIYKNPSFVILKGVGKFKINNQFIDLKLLGSELLLSGNQIEMVEVNGLDCKEVITVENLTSFYDYPETDRCVIYLGGFHNRIRKKLLCKMYEFDKNISFYHSGDIDAGGFYILNHLIEDTDIPFKGRNMDVLTLEEYSDFTVTLTDKEKERISKLRNIGNLCEYKEVFDYMLKKGVKLEQENIKY